MTDKPKFISLARVSTKRQATKGSSEDVQHSENAEFIRDFLQGDLVQKFTLTLSGKRMEVNQGALKNILGEAKKLGAEIVVSKADRITRKAVSLLQLRELSKEGGVRVWIAREKTSLDKMSLLMAGIQALVDEAERETIQERVKSSKHKGKGQFGKTVDPVQASKSSAEAKRVAFANYAEATGLRQKIADVIIKHTFPTLRQVAEELNRMEITTIRDLPFNHGSAQRAIISLGYKNLGEFVEEVKAEHGEQMRQEYLRQQQKAKLEAQRKARVIQWQKPVAFERGSFLDENGHVSF